MTSADFKSPDGKKLLSTKEAALLLRCAPDYVSRLCREGKLKGTRIDQAWFIEEGSLLEFEGTRKNAAQARARELSELRRQELNASETPLHAALKKVAPSSAWQSALLAVVVSAVLGSAVFASAGIVSNTAGIAQRAAFNVQEAAAIGQIDSPFFGTHAYALTFPQNIFGNFAHNLLALFTKSSNTPAVEVPVETQPRTSPAQQAQTPPQVARAGTTTVVNQYNTYPVTERTVERTVVQNGVSQADITAQLQQLDNSLRSQVFGALSSNSSAPPAQSGLQGAIALSQNISKLDNVTITSAHISGGSISGITIGVGSGGTGITTAPTYGQLLVGTSAGGYSLTATSSLGLTAGAGGSSGQVQFNSGGALAGSGSLTFDNTSGTLTSTGLIATNATATNATTTNLSVTNASTTNFVISSLGASSGQCLTVNSSGTVTTTTCGTGGGGSADPFTHPAAGQSATTTLVLLNGNASTTQLSVFTKAYFGATATSTFAADGSFNFKNGTTTGLAITNIGANLLKTDSSGNVIAAVAGTDYLTSSYLVDPFTHPAAGQSATTTLVLLNGNASTTQLSVFTKAYFGATATSTFSSAGVLNLAGLTSTLLKTDSSNNVVAASAGIDYATPAQIQTFKDWQITGGYLAPTTTIGVIVNASSTIGNGTQTGGLTISGGATTTGNTYIAGTLGVGTIAPSKTFEVTGTAKVSSTFTLAGIASCTGSQALQTNGSGDVSCGSITVSGSASGGGWNATNGAVNGNVTLATSTYLVAVGATTTPYAKLAVVSGAAATTTLALVPASSQTANILDIYDTSGNLASVFTAGHNFGIGTTSPGQRLSVAGNILGNNIIGSYFTATSSTVSSFTGGLTVSGQTTLAQASSTQLSVFTKAYFGATATSTFDSAGVLSLASALTVPNGGTGQTSFTAGNLLYGAGSGALQNVATSSLAVGASLSVSGTLGYQVGGTASTLSLNTANANTWSALQQFSAASSTLLSVFTKAYFGATATSTFASDGSFSFKNGTTTGLAITNVGANILKTDSSGNVIAAVAGTDYLTSANASPYPFPLAGNATSTLTQFNGGLTAYASSTIGNGTAAGGLTVNGTATTTNTVISAVTSSLLKTTSLGQVAAAVAGTDYLTSSYLVDPFTHPAAGQSATTTLVLLNGNASTTQLSVFTKAYFGATATSTFDSTGFLTLPSGFLATASSTIGNGTTAGGLTVNGGATTTSLVVSSTLTGAGLSTTCNSSADKLLWANGTFSCGTDAGAGGSTEINWTYFNGTGIRVSTSTNQVLIGATATTTTAQLEVHGGANFDAATSSALYVTNNADINGKLGLGTTSPTSVLSVAGGNIYHIASGNPTLSATISTTSTTHSYSVAVEGRYLYSADYEAGLRISDISNPHSPARVGAYTTSTQARAVAVAGKYAYVLDDTLGLEIIDVTNPATPALVGRLSSAVGYGIALSGHYAYIADFSGALLRVVDVGNPATPTQVGSFAPGGTPQPRGVAVSGAYAYLADSGNSAVYVVDISNPTAPAKVGTYNGAAANAPRALYVSGNILYVADAGNGFFSLNLKNPASPTLLGQYTTGAPTYYGVAVAGDYAYLTNQTSNQLTVLNVSASTTPALVGSVALSGAPYGVVLSGKYAYVADDNWSVNVADINGIQTPAASIGALETNSANVADKLAVGGDITAAGGLDVGISGIYSRGAIAAYVASSTQTNPVVATFIGGNVGIGTSSPFTNLSVAGGAYIGGNLTATGTLAVSGAATLSSTLNVTGNTTLAAATSSNLAVSSIGSGNLLKTTTGGAVIAAVAGTDYLTSSYLVDPFTHPAAGQSATTTLVLLNGNASTTQLSVFTKAYFGATATATIDSAGNISTAGTINTNGTTGGFQIDGNLILYASSTTHSVQVGQNAGNTSNVNASYNAFLGYNAGNGVTSGANNVIVGGFSTAANSNLSSGSNNISIGYNISLPSATANNQLNIQNILFGTNNSGSAGTYSSGQVGIGSTSPYARLSINANNGDTNTTLFAIGSSTASATTTLFTVNNVGNTGLSTTTAFGRFSVDTSNLAVGTPELVVGSSTRTDLLVAQSGNVGLAGTTTPWATLSIAAIAGQNSFAIGSSSGSYLVVNSAGNVGIGTSTPFTKLALTNGVTTGQASVAYDQTDYTLLSTNATGQYIVLPSANTEILPNANEWVCTGGTISTNACPSGTPSGQGNIIVQNKVLIGTTTSTYKLTIETQDSTTNFFQVASTTAQNLFVINSNGSVGIASSTPFAKLSIGAGGAVVVAENNLATSTSMTVNWNAGNQQLVRIGTSATTISFANYTDGEILRLLVCNPGAAAGAITWGTQVLWTGGTAPTQTTTANKCDVYTFVASQATTTLKILGAAVSNF
ncbi:MAG: hypothetical protein KGI70_03055 [Patescibacteria group bacterium]|nr:hypothetical protein [Patescibacteria group bacterium]